MEIKKVPAAAAHNLKTRGIIGSARRGVTHGIATEKLGNVRGEVFGFQRNFCSRAGDADGQPPVFAGGQR